MSQDLEQDYVAVITESAEISDNVKHKESSIKKVESDSPSADTYLALDILDKSETSAPSELSETALEQASFSKLDTVLESGSYSTLEASLEQEPAAPVVLLEHDTNPQTLAAQVSSLNTAPVETATYLADDNEQVNIERLLQQCQEWCENEEFQKIVDACLAVKKRTPEIYLELGRAYNALAIPNHPTYLQKALNCLLACSSSFHQDMRWNFRIAFTYYYLDQEWLALHFFQNALKITPDDQDILGFIESCRTCLIRPVFSCNFAQRVDYMWQNFAQQQQKWLSALHQEEPDFKVFSEINDIFKQSLSPLPLRFSISVPSSFDKTVQASSNEASCNSSDDSKDSRVLLVFNLQFSTSTALVLNFVFSKIPDQVKPYWNFSVGNSLSTPSLYSSANFVLKYQDINFKLLTKKQIAQFDQEQAAYAAAQVKPLANLQDTAADSQDNAKTQSDSIDYANNTDYVEHATTDYVNYADNTEHANTDYADDADYANQDYGQLEIIIYSDLFAELYSSYQVDNSEPQLQELAENLIDMVGLTAGECSILAACSEIHSVKIMPEHAKFSALPSSAYPLSELPKILEQHGIPLHLSSVDFEQKFALQRYTVPAEARTTEDTETITTASSGGITTAENIADPAISAASTTDANYAAPVVSEFTVASESNAASAYNADPEHNAQAVYSDAHKSAKVDLYNSDLNPESPAISYSEASDTDSDTAKTGKRCDIFYGLTMLPHMNQDFYHNDADLVDLMHSCGIAVGFIHYPITSARSSTKLEQVETNDLKQQHGHPQSYILQSSQDEYSRTKQEARLDEAKLDDAEPNEVKVVPERIKLQESLIKALSADPNIKIIGHAFGVKNDYIDFMCMGSILNLYQLLFAHCRKLGLQHKVEVSPFRQLRSLTVYDPQCVEQQSEFFAQYTRYTQSIANEDESTDTEVNVSHTLYSELPDFFKPKFNLKPQEFAKFLINYSQLESIKSQDYEELQDLQKEAAAGNAQAQYALGDVFYYGQYDTDPDYNQAFKWYAAAARQGHASAQWRLGVMYEYGFGTKLDYAVALEWYKASALQDYPPAQNSLGEMYYYGQGVEQDYQQAAQWYTAAAHQNFAYAQKNLGYMYEVGQGIDQNFQQALYWYKQASKHGNTDAMYDIGVMYHNGTGVPVDYQEAYKWYSKSAQMNNRHAQNNLGILYFNGLGVSQDYSEACKWFRLSAYQHDSTGQKNLGIMYANGYGVERDLSKAELMYISSANHGNIEAMNLLADLYFYGRSQTWLRDYGKAAQWYTSAAKRGSAYAQCCLGCMYEYGRGVELNYEQAVYWYHAAAEQGLPDAQKNLAHMFDFGIGVNKDQQAAFKWYKAAAEQGHAEAQINLGIMYEEGSVTTQDYQEAMKWYKAAAEQGNETAQQYIRSLQHRLDLEAVFDTKVDKQ